MMFNLKKWSAVFMKEMRTEKAPAKVVSGLHEGDENRKRSSKSGQRSS
ncbi:hypothetical protein [Bacillus dakarensis]|nr:hypothetical protein [Bacillus dakarensis]